MYETFYEGIFCIKLIPGLFHRHILLKDPKNIFDTH